MVGQREDRLRSMVLETCLLPKRYHPAYGKSRPRASHARIEPGDPLGQALVAHEHEEMGLGQMNRMYRVESRIAARKRETAIMREAAAGFEGTAARVRLRGPRD